MRETVVITGGNRGIGLGFVREYLAKDCMVYACYRNDNAIDALTDLKMAYPDTLHIIQLDVRDNEAILQLDHIIKEKIDILILNAGIICSARGSHPLTENENELHDTMLVNTYAIDKIMRVLFYKLMHTNACAVYISSTLASPNHNLKGRFTAYRASKIAGNMIMQNWNIELATLWHEEQKPSGERPMAFPISPGVVQTDMGNGKGDLTVYESVSQMMSVISMVRNKKQSGFYLYDGSLLQAYPEPMVEVFT